VDGGPEHVRERVQRGQDGQLVGHRDTGAMGGLLARFHGGQDVLMGPGHVGGGGAHGRRWGA